MTNLLLDTHIFIWLMNADSSLPVKSRKIIQEALSKGNVYLSAISCWEIAMLEEKKRIILTEPCLKWINDGLKNSGIQSLEVNAAISVESCKLPAKFHSDPADRMIIASARIHNLLLLTRDEAILAYGKNNYLNVLKS